MSASVSANSVRSVQEDILNAAAQCFMDRGYAATSIDDVARSLGATKGRIYHHYRSKADLFFDVYRHGMQMNFDVLSPIAAQSLPTPEKLQRMTKAHCLAMINTLPFQRCVWEGVELLKRGATTPEQRDVLLELQAMRDNYSEIFREVLEQAKAEGVAHFESSSIALQLMFMSLNSPLFWFQRREGQNDTTIDQIASQCAIFALRGLGLKEDLITDV
ncbi:TetR/AcrR family transcriptional regulator [Hoeflea sp. TYP-13]|uniref:TetR/AcrR family transcriptional regulator n=1 Tax=Hoeflea sp. TYP-13 TaxID=3230023 RepID=UPI0034C6942C